MGYSIGMPNREQDKADVLQGTLDLMILQTLATLGPLHGYAIAARLEQVSGGRFQLSMRHPVSRTHATRAAWPCQLTTEKAEWSNSCGSISNLPPRTNEDDRIPL